VYKTNLCGLLGVSRLDSWDDDESWSGGWEERGWMLGTIPSSKPCESLRRTSYEDPSISVDEGELWGECNGSSTMNLSQEKKDKRWFIEGFLKIKIYKELLNVRPRGNCNPPSTWVGSVVVMLILKLRFLSSLLQGRLKACFHQFFREDLDFISGGYTT